MSQRIPEDPCLVMADSEVRQVHGSRFPCEGSKRERQSFDSLPCAEKPTYWLI